LQKEIDSLCLLSPSNNERLLLARPAMPTYNGGFSSELTYAFDPTFTNDAGLKCTVWHYGWTSHRSIADHLHSFVVYVLQKDGDKVPPSFNFAALLFAHIYSMTWF
jgi:hypothetical protein